MPKGDSLIGGRRHQALTEAEIGSVSATFSGLDVEVDARYVAGERTRFRLQNPGTANEYGEIVFGSDIYPGMVGDPNSALSMAGAVAHELSHYHRWKNRTEIEDYERFQELDEAMTSLTAISMYGLKLNLNDVITLAGDALLRLQRYYVGVIENEQVNEPAIAVPDSPTDAI